MLTIAIITAVIAGYILGLWTSSQRWPTMRAQVQRRTLQMLASPDTTSTLDLILAEMERRQAAKAATADVAE
jgi:hypothetical protein